MVVADVFEYLVIGGKELLHAQQRLDASQCGFVEDVGVWQNVSPSSLHINSAMTTLLEIVGNMTVAMGQ